MNTGIGGPGRSVDYASAIRDRVLNMGIDPGQFFDASSLTHSTPLMRIWRQMTPAPPGWSYVRLDQDIDDAGSIAWRATVDADIAAHGCPRFMILDVHQVVATNSIAMRFKSAGWARALLQQLRQGAIYTGSNTQAGVVISTVLRFAGMANVTRLLDEAGVHNAVARYRRGLPLADVPIRTD